MCSFLRIGARRSCAQTSTCAQGSARWLRRAVLATVGLAAALVALQALTDHHRAAASEPAARPAAGASKGTVVLNGPNGIKVNARFNATSSGNWTIGVTGGSGTIGGITLRSGDFTGGLRSIGGRVSGEVRVKLSNSPALLASWRRESVLRLVYWQGGPGRALVASTNGTSLSTFGNARASWSAMITMWAGRDSSSVTFTGPLLRNGTFYLKGTGQVLLGTEPVEVSGYYASKGYNKNRQARWALSGTGGATTLQGGGQLLSSSLSASSRNASFTGRAVINPIPGSNVQVTTDVWFLDTKTWSLRVRSATPETWSPVSFEGLSVDSAHFAGRIVSTAKGGVRWSLQTGMELQHEDLALVGTFNSSGPARWNMNITRASGSLFGLKHALEITKVAGDINFDSGAIDGTIDVYPKGALLMNLPDGWTTETKLSVNFSKAGPAAPFTRSMSANYTARNGDSHLTLAGTFASSKAFKLDASGALYLSGIAVPFGGTFESAGWLNDGVPRTEPYWNVSGNIADAAGGKVPISGGMNATGGSFGLSSTQRPPLFVQDLTPVQRVRHTVRQLDGYEDAFTGLTDVVMKKAVTVGTKYFAAWVKQYGVTYKNQNEWTYTATQDLGDDFVAQLGDSTLTVPRNEITGTLSYYYGEYTWDVTVADISWTDLAPDVNLSTDLVFSDVCPLDDPDQEKCPGEDPDNLFIGLVNGTITFPDPVPDLSTNGAILIAGTTQWGRLEATTADMDFSYPPYVTAEVKDPAMTIWLGERKDQFDPNLGMPDLSEATNGWGVEFCGDFAIGIPKIKTVETGGCVEWTPAGWAIGQIDTSVGFLPTSVSSLVSTLSTGLKSFPSPSGLGYLIGQRVRATAGQAWMEGFVTTYTGGFLGLNIDTLGGTPTSLSTTSLSIAKGLKSFTTTAGLNYKINDRVRLLSKANFNNFMEGIVTSYSGTTLSLNVDVIGGTGTFADWNLYGSFNSWNLAALRGLSDDLTTGSTNGVSLKSFALKGFAWTNIDPSDPSLPDSWNGELPKINLGKAPDGNFIPINLPFKIPQLTANLKFPGALMKAFGLPEFDTVIPATGFFDIDKPEFSVDASIDVNLKNQGFELRSISTHIGLEDSTFSLSLGADATVKVKGNKFPVSAFIGIEAGKEAAGIVVRLAAKGIASSLSLGTFDQPTLLPTGNFEPDNTALVEGTFDVKQPDSVLANGGFENTASPPTLSNSGFENNTGLELYPDGGFEDGSLGSLLANGDFEDTDQTNNGDFETGDFTNWSVRSGFTGSVLADSAPTDEVGSFVALIKNNSAAGATNTNDALVEYDYVPTVVNTTYTMGAWVRSGTSSNTRVRLGIYQEQNNGIPSGCGSLSQAFSYSSYFTVTSSWQYVQWSTAGLACRSSVAIVAGIPDGQTTVAFDSITLSVVKGSATGNIALGNVTRFDQLSGSASSVVYSNAANAHLGDGFMSIRGTATNWSAGYTVNEALDQGVTYSFSAWVKSPTAAAVNGYLRIESIGGTSETVQVPFSTSGSGWKHVIQSIKFAYSGHTGAKVSFYNMTTLNTDLYVDDVLFQQIPTDYFQVSLAVNKDPGGSHSGTGNLEIQNTTSCGGCRADSLTNLAAPRAGATYRLSAWVRNPTSTPTAASIWISWVGGTSESYGSASRTITNSDGWVQLTTSYTYTQGDHSNVQVVLRNSTINGTTLLFDDVSLTGINTVQDPAPADAWSTVNFDESSVPIVYSPGVSLTSDYANPGKSLGMFGPSTSWWFNAGTSSPGYASGDFDISTDIYWPGTTADRAPFGFWMTGSGTTSPSSSTQENVTGYLFYLSNYDGAGNGFYTVSSGSCCTQISGNSDFPGLAAGVWHRLRLKAIGSTVTATVIRLDTGELEVTRTVTVPSGNRAGVFGQKFTSTGSSTGHRWDNFSGGETKILHTDNPANAHSDNGYVQLVSSNNTATMKRTLVFSPVLGSTYEASAWVKAPSGTVSGSIVARTTLTGETATTNFTANGTYQLVKVQLPITKTAAGGITLELNNTTTNVALWVDDVNITAIALSQPDPFVAGDGGPLTTGIYVDPVNAHGGSNYFEIVAKTAAGWMWKPVSYDLTAGEQYTMQAWVRSPTGTAVNGKIGLSNYGGSQNDYREVAFTATSTWQRVYLTLPVGSSSSTTTRPQIYVSTLNVPLDVDDVSVTKVGTWGIVENAVTTMSQLVLNNRDAAQNGANYLTLTETSTAATATYTMDTLPPMSKSSGVSLSSGQLKSDGNGDWWYFNSGTPGYVSGNFDMSTDVYWPALTAGQIANKDVLSIGFWITNPGTSPNGYLLKLFNGSSDMNAGFYSVNAGNNTKLADPGFGQLASGIWYRVRLTATGSSVTAVITRLDNNTVVRTQTYTMPAGNRSGAFGQVSGGTAGPNGNRLDNLMIYGAPGGVAASVPTTIASGSSYSYHAFVRSTTGAPVNGQLRLRSTGGTNSDEVASVAFTATGEWQDVGLTFTSTKTNTTLIPEIDLLQAGQLDIDSVDLHQLVIVQPDPWVATAGGGGTVTAFVYNDPTNAHEGDGLFRVSMTGANPASVYHDIDVTPTVGSRYSYTAWVRSPSGTPVSGQMVLYANGGTQQSATASFTATGSWQQVTLLSPSMTAGHTSLRSQINVQTAGVELNVDDAIVQLASWQTFGTGVVAQSQINDADSAQSGSGFLRITDSIGNDGGVQLVQQYTSAKTTKQVMTVWVRSTDGTSVNGRAVLTARGGGDDVATESFVADGSWQQVTVKVPITKDGQTSVLLQVYVDTAGKSLDLDTVNVGQDPIGDPDGINTALPHPDYGYTYLWDDAFGIPGAHLWALTAQVGFACEQVGCSPSLGVGATMYFDPTKAPAVMQGTSWLKGDMSANISTLNPCFAFSFESPDPNTYVQIQGGVFKTTDFLISIAPRGCELGDYSIEPGTRFSFDTSLGSADIHFALEIGRDDDGLPTFYQELGVTNLKLGGITYNEVSLKIDISAQASSTTLVGDLTLPMGKFYGSFNLSVNANSLHQAGTVEVTDWQMAGDQFNVDDFEFSMVTDIPFAAGSCSTVDSSTAGNLSMGSKKYSFDGNLTMDCGVLKVLHFRFAYSKNSVSYDFYLDYNSNTHVLAGGLKFKFDRRISWKPLTYRYVRHPKFTVKIDFYMDFDKPKDDSLKIYGSVSVSSGNGNLDCTFAASGDDGCKLHVEITPSGSSKKKWDAKW